MVRNARGAAGKLRVRVQANRLVIAESIAAAIQDGDRRAVVADTTDPTQVHRAERRPDVVVVVGSRFDGSTIAAVRTARRRWRQSIVIALAESVRVEDGVALLQQGADVWLSPNEGLEALRSVLSRIAAGERVLLPPSALAYIATSLRQPRGGQAPATARLTSREGQVLDCFAQGLSRPEITAMLGISQATLRTHVQNILGKLQVHSIQKAAALARASQPQPSAHDA